MSVVNLDSLTFFVLSLKNIKTSVRFLDIAEVLISEDEDLPPT
jgi:hypothetical protein